MRLATPRICVLLLLVLLPGAASAALRDFDGTERELGEHTGKGQWTVVMFWASDCPVCNAEVHQYVRFHDLHVGKDASVLGISLDGQTKKPQALEFIDRHMVDFPNLVGEPLEVAKLFQDLTGRPWIGTPSFLVYAPGGELVAQQVGPVPVESVEELIRTRSAATAPTP